MTPSEAMFKRKAYPGRSAVVNYAADEPADVPEAFIDVSSASEYSDEDEEAADLNVTNVSEGFDGFQPFRVHRDFYEGEEFESTPSIDVADGIPEPENAAEDTFESCTESVDASEADTAHQ